MKALVQTLTVGLFCFAVILTSPAENIRSDYRNWETYNGGYGGSHYSELDQINRSNVTRLEVAGNCSRRYVLLFHAA